MTTCNNCGHSMGKHTGSYCHECGEPKPGIEPRPLPRTAKCECGKKLLTGPRSSFHVDGTVRCLKHL